MKANVLSGRLLQITPTEIITSKTGKQFKKREVILDNGFENPVTGDKWDNIVAFELIGDKCAEFDTYLPMVGQSVDVSFAVNGRTYQGQQGDTQYRVSLRPTAISLHVPAGQQQAAPQLTAASCPPTSRPQQQPQPQQQGYQPSPELQRAVYQSMGYAAPQQQPAPQQQYNDELPF